MRTHQSAIHYKLFPRLHIWNALLGCCAGLFWCLQAAAEQPPTTVGNDPLAEARQSFDHPVKYAIYSPAWHLNTNAGLRIVAQNQSDQNLELRKIVFFDESGEASVTELELKLSVPAQAWADVELPYQDLLSGSDCVERTMQEDWKLVEISNYTLNPSVRGLIIEDTRSFRIYQCVRSVHSYWYDPQSDTESNGSQWLMYHFERLPID